MSIKSIVLRSGFEGYFRRLQKAANQRIGFQPSFSSTSQPVLINPYGTIYIGRSIPQIFLHDYSERLKRLIREPNADKVVRAAFELACEGHFNQYRKSGEDFITHPLAVAEIVADWGMGAEEIAAALCHDMLEQGKIISGEKITKDYLTDQLGKRVANLVDGVTELGKESEYIEKEAPSVIEIYKKLLKSGVKDISVILIKLADRLHNLRTLEYMSANKRIEKANETLKFYVKIADILGIWNVKRDMEELSLYYLNLKKYRKVSQKRDQIIRESDARMGGIVSFLKKHLEDSGIRFVSIHKEKRGIYELLERMARREIKLAQLSPSDIWRVHIVIPAGEDCYRPLGAVHKAYTPFQDEFRDAIAVPRPNGHRFLHTHIYVPQFGKLLVQLRDEKMQKVNEMGVIARNDEKESGLLKAILDYIKSGDVNQASELHGLMTLFSEGIMVSTKTGNRFQMPQGSTALDFAHRINESVFLHARGAYINGRPARLSQVLRDGDQIFIEESQNSWPTLEWLDWAQTPAALDCLRNYFTHRHGRHRSSEKTKKAALDYLNTKTEQNYLPASELCQTEYFKAFIVENGFESIDDFLLRVGKGEVVNIDRLFSAFYGRYQKARFEGAGRGEKSHLMIVAKDRPGLENDIKSPLEKIGINCALSFSYNYLTKREKLAKLLLTIEGIEGFAAEIQKLQVSTIIKAAPGVFGLNEISARKAKAFIEKFIKKWET